MALENQVRSLTLVAAADLSASQYRLIQVDSAGKAALAGATGIVVGALQNKPASGQSAAVGFHGVSKVVAGGTVAAGARVTSDANSAAITATTGDSVAGIAITAGVSGDLISVLIGAAGTAPFASIT